ncbi:MAG: glycosyltransferase [Bacteroidales bacterium]|nr:glycosyltransferase [Bacteroidales bacterium]
MQRMERDLVANVDTIICASATLQEQMRKLGRDSHLLTHGVDLGFWQHPTIPVSNPFWQNLEPPYILFWGVIDKRMDTRFLQVLSKQLDSGTIVLVGPQEDPDPAIFTIPRVVVRPRVSFDQLPSLAATASVLIMPYADIPATQAMQPLKLKEYLAAGKPTVVRDLPATRPWAEAADVATTPNQFADLVLTRLKTELPEAQAIAREKLSHESWPEKARQFVEYIEAK